jgi:peptidyl-prolyl cis-trans isomerase D
MLKVMRSSFKQLKWVLVAVIVVFVAMVFVDWGAGGAGAVGAQVPSTYAARVNGDTISAMDYERAVYFAQKNFEQSYGQNLSPEMLAALNIPETVLQNMISRELLLQEADKLGLTATTEEVRKRILEIPVLNPEGKFVGAQLYERYVTANLGYPSASAFEEDIRAELTLEKLDSALANSVVISPAWAESEYHLLQPAND